MRPRIAPLFLLGLAGSVGACFAAPSIAPPTDVLGLMPDRLVEPDEPVQVVFSSAIAPGDAAALTVRDRDGAAVTTTSTVDGAVWRLSPATVWPTGEVLEVALEGPVVDVAGRSVAWPPDGLFFEVAPSIPVLPWSVRWPTPGVAAPAGVQWVALESVAAATTEVVLVASDHEVTGRRRGTVDGLTWFELASGPCPGLCPDQIYQLEGGDVVPGVRGRVRTSTRADTQPPSFSVAEADVWPGELEVRWAADEPVRVVLRMTGAGPAEERLIGLGRSGVWTAELRLEPGEAYGLTVSGTDLVGRIETAVERRVVGPADVRVVLREFVTTPRSDWGDSEPSGVPFDASPGAGTVSSADEWVELINASERAIDVDAAGLRLRTLDRTPAETVVATAPALRFGDGGGLGGWRPGEALVVRPRGDMSQSELTVEVWAGALLMDRVVLGEGAEADHPGGSPPDLRREALARGADGRWRWCVPTPGDPRPNPACGR